VRANEWNANRKSRTKDMVHPYFGEVAALLPI
jgi:hypothetical protein